MDTNKLTKNLKMHLDKASTEKDIEVVVELTPIAKTMFFENATRNQKIETLKQAFNDKMLPVAEEISNKGGNIVDSAWINQTIHAKVPLDCLEGLLLLDEVKAIGLPMQISPD